MTDNEIIKALEICNSNESCTGCKYDGTSEAALLCFEALENFRLEDGKIVESWGYWPDKEIERILR
jgi:hypothetical protein